MHPTKWRTDVDYAVQKILIQDVSKSDKFWDYLLFVHGDTTSY